MNADRPGLGRVEAGWAGRRRRARQGRSRTSAAAPPPLHPPRDARVGKPVWLQTAVRWDDGWRREPSSEVTPGGGGGAEGRPMTPGDTDTRNIPEQRAAAAELRAQGHSGSKVR